MKSDKNILVAFLLNLMFSIFELIGGIFTNSVAIISDAIHDVGDAVSIGVAYVLERKSRRKPDKNCTYGYLRYSVLGSLITTLILLLGSAIVIYNSIGRLINPVEVNYNGMIIFAVIGMAVNFLAAYFTRNGNSLNEKAVNLHMIEDVLGWIVILIGAVIMKFTKWIFIDPLLSIGVASFIIYHVLKNMKDILNIILEKVPAGIDVYDMELGLEALYGVRGVHHIHVWSLDGKVNCATLHLVTARADTSEFKREVKAWLKKYGISHVTIELENLAEGCPENKCGINSTPANPVCACGCSRDGTHKRITIGGTTPQGAKRKRGGNEGVKKRRNCSGGNPTKEINLKGIDY